MARYKIWDRKSNIYTPSGDEYTPEEWIAQYRWASNPAAIPIICDAVINGSECFDLNYRIQQLHDQGIEVQTGGTIEETLVALEDAMEQLRIRLEEEANRVTAEERSAAALEFMAMNSMTE